jgi:Uma2 family endonuclease
LARGGNSTIISDMSIAPDNLTGTIPLTVVLPALRQEETTPRVKLWNREEYSRLAELGLLPEKHVELIGGVIYEVSPQSTAHFYCFEKMRRILEAIFGELYWVRSQGPLVAGDFSEPEPDLCVVRGQVELLPDHPTSGVLVVEISKTSLAFDRLTKACLYASMQILDYWVLDIENQQLWVHRQPIADGTSPFGHRYSQVEAVSADGSVSPLEKPEASITIAQMLPPQKKP